MPLHHGKSNSVTILHIAVCIISQFNFLFHPHVSVYVNCRLIDCQTVNHQQGCNCLCVDMQVGNEILSF